MASDAINMIKYSMKQKYWNLPVFHFNTHCFVYLMIVEFPMGSLLPINKKINNLGWKMN